MIDEEELLKKIKVMIEEGEEFAVLPIYVPVNCEHRQSCLENHKKNICQASRLSTLIDVMKIIEEMKK